VQASQDRRRGVQPGEHVHQRHADLVRRPVLGAGDRHQAALGLCHEVVAGPPRRLALGAESRDRAVHDRRVALAHRLVAHAQPVGAADLEVLDHRVRPGAQLQRQLAPLRL
jgi:hypothetical protein